MRNKDVVIRIISALLALLLILLCCACGDEISETVSKKKKKKHKKSKKNDNSSQNSSSDDTSDEFVEMGEDDIPVIDLSKIRGFSSSTDDFDFGDDSSDQIVFEIKDMFDHNKNTYWSPQTTEKTTIEYSLKEAVTFDALELVEERAYLTDFVMEVKQGSSWVMINKLDEMGNRTAILDEKITAKDFRISVTFSDERGGIAEIDFITAKKFANGKSFRNVGYFTCSTNMPNTYFDKLDSYTDLIIFGFGAWDKNGTFLWGNSGNGLTEQHLSDVINKVRSCPGGKDIHLWFCLQNYDTNTTQKTSELFATKESRDNLTQFSLELAQKYDLYGIDIDYEYPSDKESWGNYDLFIDQCADVLHDNGYKFSSAMSNFSIRLKDTTIKKIDYINMMAYDGFDSAGRHSAYALCKKYVNYFKEVGFAPEQLVMGVPFYTRTTDSTQGWGKGYSGLAERWRTGLKPWVNIVTNKVWVYYFNGPNMLRDKTYYSMNENLSGMFNWAMGSDLQRDNIYGLTPLADGIAESIKRFSK